MAVSRSNYYKHQVAVTKDYQEYLLIKKAFIKSRRTYGYRRIKQALEQDYGLILNHKKIQRIMKKYHLYQRFTNTRKPNYSRGYLKGVIRPNYLNRNFKQKGWVTDVTYLIWGNTRAYLSTILDLETRDIVSYKISSNNDLELVLNTLNQAIKNKNDLNGLILHSDQGSAYLSVEYQNICSSQGILISMSNKGSPLDNAVIESFHASLKKETLYSHDIKNLKHYIVLVKDWLDTYNTSRIRLIKKK